MKDLKRQLHSERKRAEKLQEKLQEVLTDTKHTKSKEHQNSDTYCTTCSDKRKFI